MQRIISRRAHALQLRQKETAPTPSAVRSTWRQLAQAGAECSWRQLGIPSHVYRALATFSPACMLLFGIYFTSRWRVDIRHPWIKWLVIVPVTGMTLFTMVMQIGISDRCSRSSATR